MLRLIVGGLISGFVGLATLGKYKEEHSLDYSRPARKLRWMAFKAERENRKRKNAIQKVGFQKNRQG